MTGGERKLTPIARPTSAEELISRLTREVPDVFGRPSRVKGFHIGTHNYFIDGVLQVDRRYARTLNSFLAGRPDVTAEEAMKAAEAVVMQLFDAVGPKLSVRERVSDLRDYGWPVKWGTYACAAEMFTDPILVRCGLPLSGTGYQSLGWEREAAVMHTFYRGIAELLDQTQGTPVREAVADGSPRRILNHIAGQLIGRFALDEGVRGHVLAKRRRALLVTAMEQEFASRQRGRSGAEADLTGYWLSQRRHGADIDTAVGNLIGIDAVESVCTALRSLGVDVATPALATDDELNRWRELADQAAQLDHRYYAQLAQRSLAEVEAELKATIERLGSSDTERDDVEAYNQGDRFASPKAQPESHEPNTLG